MRESLHFYYDNIYSKDMGLINVSISGGMFEEAFLPERTINEEKIRGRDKNYFLGVEYEPLSFDLEFAFEDHFGNGKLRDVARWLNQPYYKEFYFEEYPENIFYCMPSEESQIVHDGNNKGYITLTMRCDSPYSYSTIKETEYYDFLNNTSSGMDLSFTNDGDIDLYPEIWIVTGSSGGNVEIINKSDGDRIFSFSDLVNNETVYVDNENQYISTDIPDYYRYDNHNGNFLKLPRGTSNLKVYGSFKLKFRYRFKKIQIN